MRVHLISILILLSLFSCGNKKSNKHPEIFHPSRQPSDSSTYAVLTYDTADIWLFKNVTPTHLNQSEIQEIETILKQSIDTYNKEQQSRFDTISKAHPEYNLKVQDFIIILSRYKRQYFPVLNSLGQKEIWVNCFCDDFDKNWKERMISVKDGGNCYFNLIINLRTKSYYRFTVNGEA